MAETAVQNTQATAGAHIERFAAAARTLPGAKVDWVARLRAEAFERFAAAGLPSRRIEEWKFTRLDALAAAGFAPQGKGGAVPIDGAAIAPFVPADSIARLVFVNGCLAPDLSDPGAAADGIAVGALARILDEGAEWLEPCLSTGGGPAQSLVALNAAFMRDGAVIRIAPGQRPPGPVAVVHVATGSDQAAYHPRTVIALDDGAAATVVEAFIGTDGAPSASFINAVTDIRLGTGATLVHGRIEAEGDDALHVSHAAVRIAEGAAYDAFHLMTGARLARQETDARFEGAEGRLRLFSAALGRGHQHLDTTTRIDHARPGCVTDERVKTVLDDHAHGVFQGLIRVAPGAVKTDARQTSRNLLLSDHAVADTKPELEILADDVKCAHGATVGDLDADALFYLRARGIPEAEARRILVAGFVAEIIAACDDAGLHGVLDRLITAWLEDGGKGTSP